MENLIYKKMSEIFKDVEFIGKNKKNQQQGYSFRGIDDMYNALHELFAKHEVFIISEVLKTTREERVTKSGGNIIYTILDVKISFFTSDGSSVSSILIGEAMDSADKSANKAMSAALKYAMMQTFLIPTEELKDADSTTPDPSKPKEQTPTPPKLPTPPKPPTPAKKEPVKLIHNSDKYQSAIIAMSTGIKGKIYSIEELKKMYVIDAITEELLLNDISNLKITY